MRNNCQPSYAQVFKIDRIFPPCVQCPSPSESLIGAAAKTKIGHGHLAGVVRLNCLSDAYQPGVRDRRSSVLVQDDQRGSYLGQGTSTMQNKYDGGVSVADKNLAALSSLTALSPLDGRYAAQVAPLLPYFSEAALNRARLVVETEWLIALCGGLPIDDAATSGQNNGDDAGQQPLIPGAPKISASGIKAIRAIPNNFDAKGVAELAEIETRTVHDVKAIEYYLVDKLKQYPHINPALVHFALTSEDVNNLAYAINISGALQKVWLPAANKLVSDLRDLATETKDLPMLSRTHGQPATPTTLGKEIAVFVHRLQRQIDRIKKQQILGKFSGATGTFGAHTAAVPDADWPLIGAKFVESLGFTFNPLTTQIESHDWQAELFADITRFSRILHNLCTDIWTYISQNYFAQQAAAGSIGSSTMPHKINPIRFENAEANLELSIALFESLEATLVNSRLQRDLTDSTTQRNIGVAFGHNLLAIDNVIKGLKTLAPNPAQLARDLDENWEVLAEPIQTAMRAAAIAGVPGMENPYERLKELSRGQRLDAEQTHTFIKSLGLPPKTEANLLALTPATYTGKAAQLVTQYLP